MKCGAGVWRGEDGRGGLKASPGQRSANLPKPPHSHSPPIPLSPPPPSFSPLLSAEPAIKGGPAGLQKLLKETSGQLQRLAFFFGRQ